jgi:hypothetical protein
LKFIEGMASDDRATGENAIKHPCMRTAGATDGSIGCHGKSAGSDGLGEQIDVVWHGEVADYRLLINREGG